MFTSSLINIGIEALKNLLLEVFNKKGMSVVEALDMEVSFRDFEGEIENYVKGYIKRHGNIKIPGMRDSVSLEEKYSEAELLLGFQDASGFESTEELHKEFLKIGNLLEINRENYERTPALEFAKDHSRIVILGGPGMGKSTLLKKIGIEAWRQSKRDPSKKQLLPIFFELKNLSRTISIDIKREVVNEIENCGFHGKANTLLEHLLNDGRVLLILDGLDELAREKRFEAMDAIQTFSDRYNNNEFVISCRLAAYQEKSFSNFKDVEIASFKDDQIQDAIFKWFSNRTHLSLDCWKKIRLPENSRIKKLANNPLLLILICLSYQKTGRFPSDLSAVYEQAVEVLLEKWNLHKGLLEDVYEGLDKRQKEVILESIAYESFTEDKIFVYQGWMSRRIDEILEDMAFEVNLNSDEIINSIEVANGLLLKQADQVYSFSHVTIQEFFCAQHIIRKNARIKKIIDNHILDIRWQKIFIFLSGLRQSEDVLNALEEKAYSYLGDQVITNLLSWSSQKTVISESDLIPVVRRIFSIHIALCFRLYFSDTDKLFHEILYLIRSCRNLAQKFDEKISNKVKHDIVEFDKLISTLITTRQNSKAYLASPKSVSGRFIEIKDMRKQISVVCRQCKKANRILFGNKVFSGLNNREIHEFFNSLEKDALQQESSPQNYIQFCNQIAKIWIDALGINLDDLRKFQSRHAKSMSEYFYCVALLKECGDSARYFSRKKWAGIENRMLFSKWIRS